MSFQAIKTFILNIDSTDIKGLAGTTIGILSPFLGIFSSTIQTLASIGGIVLIYYSIKHKKQQYENEKNKINSED